MQQAGPHLPAESVLLDASSRPINVEEGAHPMYISKKIVLILAVAIAVVAGEETPTCDAAGVPC